MIARVIALGSVWGLGAIVFAQATAAVSDTLKVTNRLPSPPQEGIGKCGFWVQENVKRLKASTSGCF